MRTVGMGALPDNEEDKKLLKEIADLKAENTVLKQELADLKAKKPSKKGKAETVADDPVTE
jgi:cell division protein FtsB|nr:MAG TPA: DELTA-SLEEP-INDUCING PEPTIDE [Caudoviricetes sp.]